MKFCNRCGRLYSGDKCSCRKPVKKKDYHQSYYDKAAWRSLRNYIVNRDFQCDRLQLYFTRIERPESGAMKLLYDYCIDAYGVPRRLSGRLIVHHIVPREDDISLQYECSNLITLDFHTHEFVHQLYKSGHKESVQKILLDALKE